MKKILKKTAYLLIIIALTFSMQSCEIFGLEYQTDFINTPAPAKTELGISAYKFIESRKNIDMALTFEAIEKAELKSLYETDSLTFFLINDVSFADLLASKKISSVAAATKGELQTLLKGYIVKGIYTSTKNLSTTPIVVMSENGVNKIQMRLEPKATSNQDLHKIQANYVPASGVVTKYNTVISSNIKPTNGIIHILYSKFY